MKLTLTLKEKRELLTTSLQHLNESLQMWEHSIEYTDKQYLKAKQMVIARQKTKAKTDLLIGDVICFEDVISEMVFGQSSLKFIDDEDQDNIIIFDLELFNKNIDKCDPMDIIKIIGDDADYDFYTTDNVLQCLIFGEVTFG